MRRPIALKKRVLLIVAMLALPLVALGAAPLNRDASPHSAVATAAPAAQPTARSDHSPVPGLTGGDDSSAYNGPSDRGGPGGTVPLPHSVVNVMSEGIFHYPLQVGNEWTYETRHTSGQESTWRAVIAPADPAAPGYLLDGWFGGQHRLDYGPGGEVIELGDGGANELWYRLGTNVGTTWTLQHARNPVPCVNGSTARMASHTELVHVPAGEFPNAVRVDYVSPCADAGLASEWFASGVGLIKREEVSIAGPVVSVLVSAKVGEVVFPDHPDATSLTLDAETIPINAIGPAPAVTGTFRVHDQTSDVMAFEFLGCVSATVTMVDEWGNVALATRIDDGGCCTCKNPITIDLHGETLALPFRIPLVDLDGALLAPGHYSLNATLDSLDPAPVRPAATTHFVIVSRR